MEVLIGLCILAGVAVFGGLLCIAFVLFVIRLVRGATPSTGTPGAFTPRTGLRAWLPMGSLATGGTPARGILLSISSTGTRTVYYGQRCEIRGAVVDIEVPGLPPFEIQTQVYIPTNLVRDVLPGSTMELRIDPSNQSKVLVIGPDVGYTQGAVRTA